MRHFAQISRHKLSFVGLTKNAPAARRRVRATMVPGRYRSISALTRTIRQPSASNSACRSMSLVRCSESIQCWSAVVLHADLASRPSPCRGGRRSSRIVSNTSICVLCGRRPARSQHQTGAGFLRRLRPGIGQTDCFSQLDDAACTPVAVDQRFDLGSVSGPVARISASRRMTAKVRPCRRPRSNAVLAGCVTGMPRGHHSFLPLAACRCAGRCPHFGAGWADSAPRADAASIHNDAVQRRR